MGSLVHEIRIVLRCWRREGATSLISLFSLACGVATVVAVFAVLDGLWLKPLPYGAPDRLVAVWESKPAEGIDRQPTSTPNFTDWKARARSLEGIAATSTVFERSLQTDAGPVEVSMSGVTEGFFELLGVAPEVGRPFAVDDFSDSGRAVALVTHRLWRDVFAGRDDIAGLEVTLDKRPVTVLGVLPADYVHPDWRDFEQRRAELFIPMPLRVSESDRRRDWLAVVGRLADGAGLPAAVAEMSDLSTQLAREHPEANAGYRARCAPLKQALFG
ncbi:MAG: ABC transporter permease, partial [Acidobacteriota bacterium]